jgi:hypothetical protein
MTNPINRMRFFVDLPPCAFSDIKGQRPENTAFVQSGYSCRMLNILFCKGDTRKRIRKEWDTNIRQSMMSKWGFLKKYLLRSIG